MTPLTRPSSTSTCRTWKSPCTSACAELGGRVSARRRISLGIPRLALREVAERLEAFARPRDADGHVRAAVRVERQAPLGIGLLAHSGGMQRAEELPEPCAELVARAVRELSVRELQAR